jgi:hypothetical protein
MSDVSAPIREFTGLDDDTIRREIVGGERPAVLRGLVSHWPAVAAARRSPAALADYLRGFDRGSPVDGIMTPPEAAGRIFYNEGLNGFNFLRNRLPLSQVLEQVLRYAQFPHPPAVAAQSAPVNECLPGFARDNALTVLDPAVQPRIWLGNAITTPTHIDEWHNIGCVVTGRRRFTLFPPEQLANLYVGPLDYAPTGAPMSLVQLHAPDFARYPKFRTALAASVTATLAAGDALYIPPLWWHNVESLEPFNVLVNYWWHALPGMTAQTASAFDVLMLGLTNIRQLPPATRAAWRAFFEHYVFGSGPEVMEHIPAGQRGMLGELSPEQASRLRQALAQRLK